LQLVFNALIKLQGSWLSDALERYQMCKALVPKEIFYF